MTHRVHRYPARLTPYIPIYFLAIDGLGVSNGRLLDPFAGCGTVLVEAPGHLCHPMDAYGLEINPLARLIAKVKTTPLNKRSVLDAWSRIRERYASDRSRAGLPDFPNKRHWFAETVEQRFARILRSLEALRDPDLRDFFLVAASSVVRQIALADPRVSVPVILNPNNFVKAVAKRAVRRELKARRDADPISFMELAVASNLRRLEEWSKSCARSASIVGMDARSFQKATYLEEGKMSPKAKGALPQMDLVLTSPPYANAQRYTRSLRLELFALGFTHKGADEGALDRLQVGTERILRRDFHLSYERTGSATADNVISSIRRDDSYRAAIVGKYVHDMKRVASNCFDVLKPGAHAVLVLGNNSVRGRNVDNAAILAELGEQCGFEEVLRIKNRIPSRGLITKRHSSAGVITHEHVLVLKKPSRVARQ